MENVKKLIDDFILKCGKGQYKLGFTNYADLDKQLFTQMLINNKEHDCYPEHEDMYDNRDNTMYYILYHNSNITGYINYETYTYNNKKVRYLKYACNDINYRGQSISLILISLAIEKAISDKCDIIIVQSSDQIKPIFTNKFNFIEDSSTDDFDYTTPMGIIAKGVKKDFNIYYNLNEETIPLAIANIKGSISTCKLIPNANPIAGGSLKSKEKKKSMKKKSMKKKSMKKKSMKKKS